MDYSEFRINTLKAIGEKNFKVRNSYTSRSIYRALKKNKEIPDISEQQFSAIIKGVHKYYIKHFLQGSDIIFPLNMGRIELRRYKPEVKFEEGRLKINYPIDWKRTLQWWHEDMKAREQKKVLRYEVNKVFRIIYNKRKAKYSNKSFYKFTPARSFKKLLREQIINNNIDAFLM